MRTHLLNIFHCLASVEIHISQLETRWIKQRCLVTDCRKQFLEHVTIALWNLSCETSVHTMQNLVSNQHITCVATVGDSCRHFGIVSDGYTCPVSWCSVLAIVFYNSKKIVTDVMRWLCSLLPSWIHSGSEPFHSRLDDFADRTHVRVKVLPWLESLYPGLQL